MAVDIKGDTDRVREEFDGLSTPTQVFVAVLVALGIIIGFLLGGALGYGAAVEEIDENCIEYEDEQYCLESDGGEVADEG
jgi:hypothetical protein